MSNFAPTTEQQTILDAFATGGSMVIEAGAGTGKTSTLRLISESTDRKGLYIAYNRAIKDDATTSFPSNVACKTAHGLAYGSTVARNKWMKTRLSGRRIPSRQQVTKLGIPAGGYQVNNSVKLAPWIIARLATQTVGRFCYSADTNLKTKHVPFTEGIVGSDHNALAAYVLPFAIKAWADINSPTGVLKLDHDHYLKIWALTNPVLRYDFVMLDEAQDANPVIAAIVEAQPSQKIMVGDRCQAIYGWRGATDAMTGFNADHRLLLSQSFRFGPAIAAEANAWLSYLDSPLRLEGFDKVDSKVVVLEEADAILCRTNAEVIAQAMAAQVTGKSVAIVGGTREIQSFTLAANDLMNGKSTNHPDLTVFKTWGEVCSYAAEEATDLKVMVKMINTYGVDAILAVCEASCGEADADLIVSTAHKAKGREWDNVKIAGDFRQPEEGETLSAPEAMLCYVAVTRAKLALDALALSGMIA